LISGSFENSPDDQVYRVRRANLLKQTHSVPIGAST
jgi:hypothetical protein